MVMLAHVRSAYSLSNGTYGSARMTRELQGQGFDVGRRRIARLMGENGMRARQKRRFKKPRTAIMLFRSCLTSLRRISRQPALIRNEVSTCPIFGRKKGGCTSPSSSTFLLAVSLIVLSATDCIAGWLSRLSKKP
jgi:transposase InsO family protein